MPTIIEKLSTEELKNDYYESKGDAEVIERLRPWELPTDEYGRDYWLNRVCRNRAIMSIVASELERRGIKL